jgi:hypothetical protein
MSDSKITLAQIVAMPISNNHADNQPIFVAVNAFVTNPVNLYANRFAALLHLHTNVMSLPASYYANTTAKQAVQAYVNSL